MPQSRLKRTASAATTKKRPKDLPLASAKTGEKIKCSSPLFTHRSALKTPPNAAPGSPTTTVSPLLSPHGTTSPPQAMSTPLRSVLDDFMLSQNDQVDVRWDTSSPDAVMKARKLASKDNGRKTIEMLAAGIKRDPSLEAAPSTPALLRVWLSRPDDVITEDATKTPRPKLARGRRRFRRDRDLRGDRAQSDAATKNLIDKIAELIEREKELEKDAHQSVEASQSDELTYSEAVEQLENLSTNDESLLSSGLLAADNNDLNNSPPLAAVLTSPVAHSAGKSPSIRPKIDQQIVGRAVSDDKNGIEKKMLESKSLTSGQNEQEVKELNNNINSAPAAQSTDSSWEDDDLFADDSFLAKASQITELYESKRVPTPKALKNSARVSQDSRDIKPVNGNVSKHSNHNRPGNNSVGKASASQIVPNRNSVVGPIPKSNTGSLVQKQTMNYNLNSSRNVDNSIKTTSVIRPIPKSVSNAGCAVQKSNSAMNSKSGAIKSSTNTTSVRNVVITSQTSSHSLNSTSSGNSNKTPIMAGNSGKSSGSGNAVAPKKLSPSARPFPSNCGVKQTNLHAANAKSDNNHVDIDGDTSLPDDVLLQLAEPDEAWEAELSSSGGSTHTAGDRAKNTGHMADRNGGRDRKDGKDGQVRTAAVGRGRDSLIPPTLLLAADSPIPPTMILTPSPPNAGGKPAERKLSYKPALRREEVGNVSRPTAGKVAASAPNLAGTVAGAPSGVNAGATSAPHAGVAAVTMDDFDGDDSLCQPDVLAQLDKVEFEATQSMRASQSPPPTSQPCSANEIQRKREAALRKRRLAQMNKDANKRGKFN